MDSLNRRTFVGSVLAGAALVAKPGAGAGAPLPRPRTGSDPVTLGRTGIRTSLLGFGTGYNGYQGSSAQTRAGFQSFERLVRHCYDKGIRLFDCAELYGSHDFLSKSLRGLPRESYTIQSKIWFGRSGMPQPTTDATAAVERFLRELHVDYLDTCLLHCTSSGGWLDELKVMRDQLAALKERGLVKAVGTSCHSRRALDAAHLSDWTDVVLARINHRRVAMDDTPEAIAELLRQMRAKGQGVIGMKIFGAGKLVTDEDKDASLRYVFAQQCVDAMVIGFEQVEQVDDALTRIEAALAATA